MKVGNVEKLRLSDSVSVISIILSLFKLMRLCLQDEVKRTQENRRIELLGRGSWTNINHCKFTFERFFKWWFSWIIYNITGLCQRGTHCDVTHWFVDHPLWSLKLALWASPSCFFETRRYVFWWEGGAGEERGSGLIEEPRILCMPTYTLATWLHVAPGYAVRSPLFHNLR